MDLNPISEGQIPASDAHLIHMLREALIPIDDLPHVDLRSFVERVGEARVALLGASTHGSREFYEMRARMTLELLKELPFNLVALEADWLDVESINQYVHGRAPSWQAFHHFPQWMWRNNQFARFVDQVREHNLNLPKDENPVTIVGLDIYGFERAIGVVRDFLDRHNQKLARKAREAEDCVAPWKADPASYGIGVWRGEIAGCEGEIKQLAQEIFEHRFRNLTESNSQLLSVLVNTQVMADAEEFYREIYRDPEKAWNLRERHMFETLKTLFEHFGSGSRAVVWAHGTHIGDARATVLVKRGQLNLGELCREYFGDEAYLVGCMTDHGKVAASRMWGGLMYEADLPPAPDECYESLFHATGIPAFFLPLKRQTADLVERLKKERAERNVGVIYAEEAEVPFDVGNAELPSQYDEVLWIDETTAIEALRPSLETGPPDTYPFGL